MSDIFGNVDLTVYPIVALVIFLVVFAVAMVRVARTPRSEVARLAMLPMDDEPPAVEKGAAS